METVKGFKDYSGEESRKRALIKEILVSTFRKYGFEPAETPIVEYEEFVKGNNSQDEAISDIFKLQDKGKRKLALRYELTFPLKRLSRNKKLPYKRYQIGPVFRDEPTSSNRFRQFTQCDIDIIGSNIKDEAEILAVGANIFKQLGIKTVININNRKLLNEILEKAKVTNKAEVINELDKLDKLPEKEVKQNLKKYKAESMIKIFKKPESYFKKYDAYKEVEELKKYCKYYGVKVNFQPSLARGLSYYTGSIYEIKTSSMKETISAGGSYRMNNLQATGISFGLERISALAKIKTESKRVLIISISEDKKSIDLAENLRKQGIECSVMFGKISKAMEFADSYQLPFVIFIGKKELSKKKVKLRNMNSGKEQLVSLKELPKKLL